ncbi:MAG: DUF885 family protein [Gammaproteobacteria bacterium]|nr:DUF885 family protein [Gammaproteobacteria bacterium]
MQHFKIPHLLILFLVFTLAACSEQPSKTKQAIDEPLVDTEAEVASESAKANAFYQRVFEQAVSRSPEAQTYLGRKTNMDKWDDLSEEFALETLQIDKQNLAELLQFDVSKLDQPTRLSYDLMKQNLQEEIEDFKWRLYNYPVNQMFGTHSGVPSLLINQHRVTEVAGLESYIGRLNNIPTYFDQLIVGLKARADAGIVPPKFVFPHVIRDSKNVITGAPFDDGEPGTILSDFTNKLEALAANEESALTQQKQDELLNAANSALLNAVKPAYEKLVDYLTELETTATSDDGIWKWKDGDTFYNVALARTTTTDLTSEQIHQIGLDEVKRIHEEMRKIKDTVKFDGDLAEFMAFMRDDSQFYYPDTEEGKARYLREATALIETMKSSLDEMFITKPVADIKVKAVEAFREQSAGKAFYQRPSEDGTRPGLYYANLFDMEAMPTYQMEALAYHEGIPGHHMQLAIAQELKNVPMFRKFGSYTAYTEGWGLYSELLPKEFGFYSDPYSDFGRLAMELWRACRLVVDTGIHAKKWTREQGIEYYSSNTPNAVSDGVKMVERHIVMPSQATAYKIGMLKILELREAAKQSLGDKFDIRGFHDQVLKYGPLPLNVLEDKINAWVAEKLAA